MLLASTSRYAILVLCPAYFSHAKQKIGLAQDYCTPQEQECYKFVMPRPDLGRGLGMKLKFDLPVPAYIAFKHGSHTYCMYQCQCTLSTGQDPHWLYSPIN